MEYQRVLGEAARLLRRPVLLVLLSLPIAMIGLSYWGQSTEARTGRASQLRTLAIARDALGEGTIDQDRFLELEGGVRENLSRLSSHERILTFPNSAQFGLQTLATAGGLFVALAAALAFSSEFAWRTIGQVVLRAPSRARVLRRQFLGFLVAVTPFSAVAIGLALVLGFFSAQGDVGAWNWVGFLVALFGAGLALTLWAAIGLLVALLTRSPGPAVASAVGIWIANLLLPLFAPVVQRWLLDHNLVPLLTYRASHFIHGMLMPAGIQSRYVPNLLVSALALLLAISLIFLVTFRRFERMDLL